MTATLGREEKERILRTLEVDREFRYAMMGLLGFSELLERFARLEERQQKLEERFAKLEERQARVEEELREMRRVMAAIAHRFGMLSESAFREAMRYVVEEALGAGVVEKWVYRDSEGLIFGYPSVIEADVVIKDGKHILVEIKSRVSKWDVAQMRRIKDLYERVKGVKAEAVIVGGFIDPGAWEASKKLDVEIKPAFRED